MGSCPNSTVAEFEKRLVDVEPNIVPKMLRVNGLTLSNAVLAVVLVGIGSYGTRYRHRDFIRALFQGASTLFLPILSYVASNASTITTVLQQQSTYSETENMYTFTYCDASVHVFLILMWAGLVHIVGINTCTIVAASKREGRIIGLPMVLLVQAIWSTYLMVTVSLVPFYNSGYDRDQLPMMILLPITFALIFTKIAFKYYEFQKARHSFAFGRNPPLIVGYMKQLQEGSNHGSTPPPVGHFPPPPPPALIVMGEDGEEVEKGAHGFFFKRLCNDQDDSMTGSLLTMDKVWQFNDDMSPISSTTWRLKEVCLSFTLFKLLRCQFAGYTVAEAGFPQVRDFFLHVLLKDNDHEWVHGRIADELSFLHDYYYSSIPIHYSNFWLPIVNICISLLTIIHCLLLAGMAMGYFILDILSNGKEELFQVLCCLGCQDDGSYYYYHDFMVGFGNLLYDVAPVAILLALVVLAEAREIASYICSHWTKVAIFSACVVSNHDAWQRSPRMQKWIGRLLQCQSNKLMTHWDDKMYQCSVLLLHPRRIDRVISLVMRLLRLPDRKKNVKVPGVVKARIFNALSSNYGFLTHPKTFLCQSLRLENVGSDDFLWAFDDSKGISDLLLMWHIATSILEVRQGQHSPPLSEDDMTVATHLSRYCAYLVAYVPELLPDDDEWCKSLYKAVKKDSMRVLHDGVAAPSTTEESYNRLVALLEKAEHVVLKKGVKLGKQLVELLQRRSEQATWRFLAGFWSGMILYIAPSNNLKGHAAPSENLKGHAEAIARGGELITLVWALLMNVGIDSRPSSTEASPAATVDDV